jgi:hypothetical protein
MYFNTLCLFKHSWGAEVPAQGCTPAASLLLKQVQLISELELLDGADSRVCAILTRRPFISLAVLCCLMIINIPNGISCQIFLLHVSEVLVNAVEPASSTTIPRETSA